MTFVTEQKGRKGLRDQLVLMDKMVLTEPMVHKVRRALRV